ncbi:hypothetical protein LCGC14_2748930, partial [marine sediment metagenome]
MPTRIALYRALAEAQYADKQDVITGVATDHTTTTVKDTAELLYSSGDANAYDYKYVYLEAIKQHARVTEAGYAGSTGILSLSGTVTDAPAVVTGTAANVSTTATTLTDTDESMTVDEWIGYTVYAGGQTLDVTSNTATVLTGTGGWSEGGSGPGAVVWTVGTRYVISGDPPRVLRQALGHVLRNMYEPSFFPLSLWVVPGDNNDFEGTLSDGFAALNSTLTQETTIVRNGAASAKVTALADDGYLLARVTSQSNTFGVSENKQYYTAASVYVKQGDDAELRVTNVQDASATIENATSDEPNWMDLIFSFTPPSGCEQIAIRLISTTNEDIVYWDDFQVWAPGRQVYSLPSWVTRPAQVIDVRAFPRGTTGPASDNDFRSNEARSEPLPWGF